MKGLCRLLGTITMMYLMSKQEYGGTLMITKSLKSAICQKMYILEKVTKKDTKKSKSEPVEKKEEYNENEVEDLEEQSFQEESEDLNEQIGEEPKYDDEGFPIEREIPEGYEEVLEEVSNNQQNPDEEEEEFNPMTLNTNQVLESSDLQ